LLFNITNKNERGIFELIRGNTHESTRYLNLIEKFATKAFILPEQIFKDGTPTESSAPLAWSHATYMFIFDLLIKGITPSFQNPWI
jgi:GH15 family glucan-1,4-alpha-glucosidase